MPSQLLLLLLLLLLLNSGQLLLTEDVSLGTLFGYGSQLKYGDGWEKADGTFSLSTEGEQIFLYCQAASGDVRHLAGLSWAGDFSPPGLPNYGLNESALPDQLKELGSVALDPFPNYAYGGPSGGQIPLEDLQEQFQDPSNWQGSSTRFGIGSGSGAAGTIGASCTLTAALALCVLVSMYF